MLTRVSAYLTNLRHRRRARAEADDELAFHVEMATEAGIAAGLSAEEARRQALRELGSVTAIRDGVHDARATWFDSLWQDVRFSLATLRRSPAFVVTAMLVLGLGIGVNAAVFSIVDAIFFTPPPVESPERLVYIYSKVRSGLVTTSYYDLDFFARSNDVFSDMTAHWSRGAVVTIGDESGTVEGEFVAANYFDVLGVKPLIGRTFRPGDGDLTTTEFSMVISHDFWVHRFAGDPHVVGRHVQLQNKAFTIVGVTPEGFRGLCDPWSSSQYWVTGTQAYGADYRRFGVGLIGRLRPGVAIEQAQANIAVLNEQLWREQQVRLTGRKDLIPLPSSLTKAVPNPAVLLPLLKVRTPFWPEAEVVPLRLASAVATVVALVLLIAATNIAGLLSARALSRTQEVAVRRALGCGSGRLMRQLTIESLMLSLGGGGAGLFVARWLMELYRAYTPERYVVDVSLNLLVTAFAFALCLTVGLCVGLAPTMQAMRVDVLRALGGTAGPTARSRRRLRHGVIIPQVAAAMVLLLVAGVHLRGLAPMEAANVGFRTEGITTMYLGIIDEERPPSPSTADAVAKQAERQRRFLRELTTRLEGAAGGSAVALADALPVYTRSDASSVVSRERAASGDGNSTSAAETAISARFFATLDMPLREGRDFDARDVRESPHVAIVSSVVASRLWPGRSAVGRELGVPDRDGTVKDWLTVVGVVPDTTDALKPGVPMPALYVPLSQQWRPSPSNMIARLPTGGTGIAALRGAVVTADPDAAVSRVRMLSEMVDEMLYPRRAATWILAASGVAGLLLATIGLYGVVSHSVLQRMREISIRMTVGADKRDVISLVLREGAWVATLGAVIGLPLSVWALRVTANLVGPMPTFDWLVVAVVPTIVVAVVLVACYLPARRAANADPASVLRGL
jgi:predicted permease